MKKQIFLMVIFATSCIEAGKTTRDQGAGSAQRQQPPRVENIPIISTGGGQPRPPVSGIPNGVPAYSCSAGVNPAICSAEQRIFELTNNLRRSSGATAFQPSIGISFVARDWSTQQTTRGIFGRGGISHVGFPRARYTKYTEYQRLDPSRASANVELNAENVAYTYASSPLAAADDLFEMWRTSTEGHLDNMMGNFRRMGIGIAVRDGNQYYATQIMGAE